MLRRLAPAAAMLALAAAPLRAQLGLITVPRGSFRVDLGGAFHPNDEVWVNGTRQPLGSFLNGTTNLAVTSLQSSLAALLGQPVTGLSLGGVTAIASRDHGVGDLGFAFGVTDRITVFGNLPIVYVHSHVKTAFDPASSRVGINPANPKLGTATGQDAAQRFTNEFDTAIDTLKTRLQGTYYTGADATLAQQTLASATAMRAALQRLLFDSLYASPVLPTAADPYSVQLLSKITTLQGTMNGPLALPEFATVPEFPATTLTAGEFDTLLNEPQGLGLGSPNNLPHYGVGDMSAGVAFALVRRGAPGGAAWSSVSLRATARFPNGTQPDPTILLDQGTGARRKALQLDGVVEVGRRTMGLRSEASYLHQLPGNALIRPTQPDDLIVPPSFLVAVTTTPGDSLALTARPWLTFAPHLALSGLVQYWRRNGNSTRYLTGQVAIPGVDPTLLDIGSAANAFVAGLGLSYFHDGRGRDGSVSMPVEAGWSIERTITSSTGILPVNLTSRVYLRIYRPLIKH